MIAGVQVKIEGQFCINSLYFSLLAGNLTRERFAEDSVHRQKLSYLLQSKDKQ